MTPPQSTKLLGIGLVLLSSLSLSIQNVVLRLFFSESRLFGQIPFGGFVTPHLSNVVLLLAIRMAMMTLLLTGLIPWLYPKTFRALGTLPKTPRLLGAVLASGVCLFLGLILLYMALSQVAAGIAISTLFIYPAITVLLAWLFFHQVPQTYQLGFMVVISIGVVLTSLTTSVEPTGNPLLGGICALGAGLGFGLYGIFAELSLKGQPGLHPVPFSLFTFAMVAVLASLALMVLQEIIIEPAVWAPVLGMTFISAIFTLVAYILNNFGIGFIGASLTALLTASAPALTALLAWWVVQEALEQQQIIGIGLVTLGVSMLSLKSRHTH
ncbi:DMT family transporter [Leptothoe sp. PORK10 BA2]|uniref:DMT family transporter n=1 Tax=Leptothoe sp. PORK10 BA2 TaxID=3110254 RepID=UPI002B220820|nr:DMT family transporter [Leptothoe sp. PORK10 BA2]MEA5466322.1 DMT family transporter [Leptothoe sp. PORK10 BA2]